jgi:hypothetical protein
MPATTAKLGEVFDFLRSENGEFLWLVLLHRCPRSRSERSLRQGLPEGSR